MNKTSTAAKVLGALLLALGYAASANAASMLRITCDGLDSDAMVSINGKSRGPCPIDVQVPAGTVKVSASKTFPDGKTKLFEKTVQLGDGSIVKVPVQLISKEGFDIIRKAEAGDRTSMALLGAVYYTGSNGLPKDPERSFYWFLKAAERGDSGAMIRAGTAYEDGEVIPKDDAAARSWYKRGFEQASREAATGNVDAMITLGRIYARGLGVPQDRAQAAAWFRRVKEKDEGIGKQYLDMYGLN